MTASGTDVVPAGDGRLRVLIANERRDRLELLADVVSGLGHEVIAREIYVKEVGPATSRELPDVAIVGLGLSSEHALELIGEIVREASCPVIALLHANDPAYIREAAKRGVFAYIIEGTPEELQSAIDITLQRFTEYHNLQGAFGRRATIEQAKGILMARHAIDADKAFEMLRDHSQHNGRKLVDVAAAIVESHLLLLPPPGPVAVAPDPIVHRRPPIEVRQIDGAPMDAQAAHPNEEGTTMTAHQNIAEWHGKDLVDEAGDKVGKLEEVYVDVETDEPMFGTVKEGLVGRHLTFVPLLGLTIGPDSLQLAVSRDLVKAAPNIELNGEELSQDDESSLYHHYQLNYAPPETESGRRLARR